MGCFLRDQKLSMLFLGHFCATSCHTGAYKKWISGIVLLVQNAFRMIWAHYNDITWGSWHPKSLAIQLFVQNLLRLTLKKTSMSCITGHHWGFPSQRSSRVESIFMSWSNNSNDILHTCMQCCGGMLIFTMLNCSALYNSKYPYISA